jgi:hypothetical protein
VASMRTKNVERRLDDSLDAEIEAALAKARAERAALEQDAHSSYWAALKLRCAILADMEDWRAVRKMVAALSLATNDGTDSTKEEESSSLALLAACNRRLSWPYSSNAGTSANLAAQALDGAVMVLLNARQLDGMTTGFQRRIRWPALGLLVLYGVVREGPRALALLLLPLCAIAAGLILGAVSGGTRPLLGTSQPSRLFRGAVAGALGGVLLMLPLPLALGNPAGGRFWMWVLSGAIIGMLFGPMMQPSDEPYRDQLPHGAGFNRL